MERLLISACLTGAACRYDGGSGCLPELPALMERYDLVPVCGECMGGLPTPRPAAERVGERVLNRAGTDVTAEFLRGAERVLEQAERYGCRTALLKERSPSCGSGRIYDGTFSGTLTDGWGVTAERLREHGVRVLGESRAAELLEEPD